MNASTMVNVNGQGLIVDDNGFTVKAVSNYKQISVGELFKRAEIARRAALGYIEAAENMERLAMTAITEKIL